MWENQINKQKEDKKTMKSQTPRSQQTEVPEVFWHSAIRYVLSSARSRGHLLVVWFIFTCHLHVLPHRLNSAGPLSSLSSAPPFSSLSSYHPPRYPEPCSSFSPVWQKTLHKSNPCVRFCHMFRVEFCFQDKVITGSTDHELSEIYYL